MPELVGGKREASSARTAVVTMAGRSRICACCDRRVSATVGTIFHGTRTPLTVWFSAAWLLVNSTNGISATQCAARWSWARSRPPGRCCTASGLQAHEVLPAVHRVFSLVKRWLTGTMQGSVSRGLLFHTAFAPRGRRRGHTAIPGEA